MPPTTLGTREVAEKLDISPQTVRRLADRGVLPAIRVAPYSPRRFRVEDVDRVVERSRRETVAV